MADLTTKPISRGRAGEWLDRALWTALFLACAVAISKNQADPDFWGHVQYGRDALRDGLPHTAMYSYTAEGHRWINHENLSEFAFAAGIDWIGPSGLLAVKCVLGLTVLGLILRGLRRRGAGLLTSFAATMLAAMNLMFFWSLRPQVFSYTLFALLMALVDWCFRDWESDPPAGRGEPWDAGRANRRLRWLWAAAPLFALWANTHGAFVAGYLMFAVYLASRGVEAWVRHGRQAMGAAVHFAAVIIAAGLATALNPYGFELHAWLRRSLSAPRPEIVEWLPPELLSVAWAPLWLMAAVCVAALAASRRKRDYTHLLLLGLTLWQAIEHRRHIPFFTILVGFWMGGHIQSLLDRLGVFRNTDSLGAGLSPAKRRGLGACACAASILAVWILLGQLWRIPVRRDNYPVSAMQYIADQELTGKIVVQFRWSQYAIAAFHPRRGDEGLLVAFDGRYDTCYPREVVDLYFDFAVGDVGGKRRYRSPQSPPVDGSRILEQGRPDLVLIDRALAHARGVMHQHRDAWVLLYQDRLAQLWGRAAKYDDPRSADYVHPARRRISEQPQTGLAAWPALPLRGSVQEQLAAR